MINPGSPLNAETVRSTTGHGFAADPLLDCFDSLQGLANIFDF